MKKPTETQEKVIIKPRPPQDATTAPTQECPAAGTTAQPTAAPNTNPAQEVSGGQADAEDE